MESTANLRFGLELAGVFLLTVIFAFWVFCKFLGKNSKD